MSTAFGHRARTAIELFVFGLVYSSSRFLCIYRSEHLCVCADKVSAFSSARSTKNRYNIRRTHGLTNGLPYLLIHPFMVVQLHADALYTTVRTRVP